MESGQENVSMSNRNVKVEIPENYRGVFPFDDFNDMQSAIFDQAFHSDVRNLLFYVGDITYSNIR